MYIYASIFVYTPPCGPRRLGHPIGGPNRPPFHIRSSQLPDASAAGSGGAARWLLRAGASKTVKGCCCLGKKLCIQGGPRVFHYKWTFKAYKWPKIHGFACGYNPYKWLFRVLFGDEMLVFQSSIFRWELLVSGSVTSNLISVPRNPIIFSDDD